MRSEDGASAVELAVVLPLLMLLLGGFLNFGYAIVIRQQVVEAAQEGVAMLSRDPNAPNAKARIAEVVTAVDPAEVSVRVTCPNRHGAGRSIRVRVRHDFDFFIPMPLGNETRIQVVAHGDMLTADNCVVQ